MTADDEVSRMKLIAKYQHPIYLQSLRGGNAAILVVVRDGAARLSGVHFCRRNRTGNVVYQRK